MFIIVFSIFTIFIFLNNTPAQNIVLSEFANQGDVLTAPEIYALLDAKDWSKGIEAARVLVDVQPQSATAHIVLGDPLSHYLPEDGDVFSAFDAWMQAKELSPQKSSTWNVAKERLGWCLERSGINKISPSPSSKQKGWSKDFTYTLQTSRNLDLSIRTDVMMGGVYITNISIGEVILEVKTSKELPFIIQKYTDDGEKRCLKFPIHSDSICFGWCFHDCRSFGRGNTS